jgi:hypothetical protein
MGRYQPGKQLKGDLEHQDDEDTRPPPSWEEDRLARWEAIFGPGVIELPLSWDKAQAGDEDIP